VTSSARGSQDEKARCGSRRVVRERGMENVMRRSAGDRHNKHLQLTAFGAQDRSDFATILCTARLRRQLKRSTLGCRNLDKVKNNEKTSAHGLRAFC
jgi:hypothetical protein